ncbi:hypothetical protein PDN64_27735, partial [Bacillus cereus group sp. Bc256]
MRKIVFILCSIFLFSFTVFDKSLVFAEAVPKITPDYSRYTVETMKEIGRTQGQVTFLNQEAEDKFYRDLYRKTKKREAVQKFTSGLKTVTRVGGNTLKTVVRGATVLGLASIVLDGIEPLKDNKPIPLTYDSPSDMYTSDSDLSGRNFMIVIDGPSFIQSRGEVDYVFYRNVAFKIYFIRDGLEIYQTLANSFMAGSLKVSEGPVVTNSKGGQEQVISITYIGTGFNSVTHNFTVEVSPNPMPSYVPGISTRTSVITPSVVQVNPSPQPNPFQNPDIEYVLNFPYPPSEPIYTPQGEKLADPGANYEPSPEPKPEP